LHDFFDLGVYSYILKGVKSIINVYFMLILSMAAREKYNSKKKSIHYKYYPNQRFHQSKAKYILPILSKPDIMSLHYI